MTNLLLPFLLAKPHTRISLGSTTENRHLKNTASVLEDNREGATDDGWPRLYVTQKSNLTFGLAVAFCCMYLAMLMSACLYFMF